MCDYRGVCVSLSLSLSLSGLSLFVSLSYIYFSPGCVKGGTRHPSRSLHTQKRRKRRRKKKEKKGRATFASLFLNSRRRRLCVPFLLPLPFFSNKKQKKETYFIDKRARVPALATISSRDETCLPRYALLATRCLLLRQIKRR